MISPCSNELIIKVTNGLREVGIVRKQRDNTKQQERQWSVFLHKLINIAQGIFGEECEREQRNQGKDGKKDPLKCEVQPRRKNRGLAMDNEVWRCNLTETSNR